MHFIDKTLLKIYINHWEQHMTLPWKAALQWFGSEQQSNSNSWYMSLLSQEQWAKPLPKPMSPTTANNRRGGVRSSYRERSQSRQSALSKNKKQKNKP